MFSSQVHICGVYKEEDKKQKKKTHSETSDFSKTQIGKISIKVIRIEIQDLEVTAAVYYFFNACFM